MKRVNILVVASVVAFVGLANLSYAAHPLALLLREELKIKGELLQEELSQLERHDSQVQEAWVRVERLSADLLRAQNQDESLESLRLRDQDLRLVEAELQMHLEHSQRLRHSIMSTRAEIDKIAAEVLRLEDQLGRDKDPLTGTWRIVSEPGGQEGYLYLELNGTLVSGTYTLSGGWSGSLRGTLVARKIRLERIDSQIGFAAKLFGRLKTRGTTPRIEGTWDSTQLAVGLPTTGTWFAEKVEELPE